MMMMMMIPSSKFCLFSLLLLLKIHSNFMILWQRKNILYTYIQIHTDCLCRDFCWKTKIWNAIGWNKWWDGLLRVNKWRSIVDGEGEGKHHNWFMIDDDEKLYSDYFIFFTNPSGVFSSYFQLWYLRIHCCLFYCFLMSY